MFNNIKENEENAPRAGVRELGLIKPENRARHSIFLVFMDEFFFMKRTRMVATSTLGLILCNLTSSQKFEQPKI